MESTDTMKILKTTTTKRKSGDEMGGLKNPLQQRNWSLPQVDKSSTIEERALLLQKSLLYAPIYCHFCGLEIILESNKGRSTSNAIEDSKGQQELGAHYDCLNKHLEQFN